MAVSKAGFMESHHHFKSTIVPITTAKKIKLLDIPLLNWQTRVFKELDGILG